MSLSSEPTDKPSLLIHEWLAIAIIIGLLAMLTIISKPASISPLSSPENFHYLAPTHIEMAIDGAVERPGKYHLKKGSLLQDLLDQAKILPTAELKHLNLKAKLRKGQVVHVPSQEMITVYLEGAVIKPGPYQFLKGTRLMDLKDRDLFTSGADLKLLNKKRRLKHNEVLSIP
jgi:DNA uptake protein ComE-like DNA-binding protein